MGAITIHVKQCGGVGKERATLSKAASNPFQHEPRIHGSSHAGCNFDVGGHTQFRNFFETFKYDQALYHSTVSGATKSNCKIRLFVPCIYSRGGQTFFSEGHIVPSVTSEGPASTNYAVFII